MRNTLASAGPPTASSAVQPHCVVLTGRDFVLRLDTQLFIAGIVGSLVLFVLAMIVLWRFEYRRGFRRNRMLANIMLCVAVFSLMDWALADFSTDGLAAKTPFVIALSVVASVASRIQDRLDRGGVDS